MSKSSHYTRLSSKGQVVLPRDVRDRLRLKEGTELSVRTRGQAIILEPVKKRSWRRWRGALKGTDMLSALEREHLQEIKGDALRT